MNATTLRFATLALLATFALAACNDDNTTASDKPSDQFGSTFSDAFGAGPNEEPIDPASGDAGTLSPAGDPVKF